MDEKQQEFGWWIEILTSNPDYLYYFGAFDSYWEAEWFKDGYIRDLDEEKAKIVNIDRKSKVINLSIKAKDEQESKAALQEHNSRNAENSNNATLGDILKQQMDK